MLEKKDKIDSWNIETLDTMYEMKSSDRGTINRVANSCNDLAWSLEITANDLLTDGHCVIATKRGDDKESWVALCKSSFDD